MATAEAPVCTNCEIHAEAVFRVEGMDCNEEVVILERRLRPLAGMEALSADLVGQRLHVSYDAAKLTTAAIVDAVGQTGMRMWLEHEGPGASGPDVRVRFWLTVASGAAILAALAVNGWSPALAVGLFIAATIAGGVFPARRALVALRTRTVDINVLMVIAVVGAMALRQWFEGASVVFLFALAQWLEARTLGARPSGHSRPGRALAARGHRQTKWRRAPRAGRDHSRWAPKSSFGPATRSLSMAGFSPDMAT